MVKLKETNLDGVKAMARTLLFTDIHKTSLSPIVVQHPFTSSGFNMVMINGEPKCVDITADNSPTVSEEALHRAIVRAIQKFNREDEATYMMLMKATIGDAIGLNGGNDEIDLLERRVDALNKQMLNLVNESVKGGMDVEDHEEDFKEISAEIEQLNNRIKAIRNTLYDEETSKRRLALIQSTIDDREKNEGEYDDSVVRQMVECIKVYHDGRIEVIFGGGHTFEESLNESEEN